MNSASQASIQLNGMPANVDDLRSLVQTNYGHFTVMRVENGGVRGLDLHLDRLERATQELFDTSLDRDRVRDYLRCAIDGETRELSLRVNIFSRALNREQLARPVQIDVLVIASAATPRITTPLRLKSFRYTRELATIKHVGTFPLFHYRRLAQQAGFDDALFVDGEDRIGEGSIWNIGFVDASRNAIWPDAPQLDGVSMHLLKEGLRRQDRASLLRSIRLADLIHYRGAFFTNATTPIRAIACIDAHEFAIDEHALAMLHESYEINPWQKI